MAQKYRKIKRQKIHYKGRRNKKGIIKTVLFVILILALVFLAYSVAGPIKQLLSGELSGSSALPSSQDQSSSRVENESDVISSQPQHVTAVNAVVLPLETALDGAGTDAFLDTAVSNGYNAVLVELKDENGVVWFRSDEVAAMCKNAVAENALSASELAKKIKDRGMKPIAAVHTFKDKTAPDKAIGNTFMIKNSNSTWWDNSAEKGGKPWLNPYKDNARAYNVKIVEELAKAGFESVVLRSVQFPDVKSMDKADLGGTVSVPEILSQYIAEAQAVAESNGAEVLVSYDSVGYWNAKAVAYGGEAGGIRAERIAPVIRISDYGAALMIGGTTIENPSSDLNAAIKAVVEQIKSKTGLTEDRIVPVIAQGQDAAAIKTALEAAGIQNYITE